MDMVRRPKLIIGTPTPHKGAFEPACIAAIDALKLHLRGFIAEKDIYYIKQQRRDYAK